MAPQPTNQETLDKVLELISRRADTYQIGVQTTICWKSDSDWLNAITKLEFIRKGDGPPSERRHEYHNVEIIRRLLTQTEVAVVLKQLVERNLLETSSDGKGLRYEPSFLIGGKIRQPYSEWSQWPADIFEIQRSMSSGQNWPPDEPLIAVNAPHYPSFENVLFDLFGIRVQGWTNYLRGQVTIVLPDFRARISSLTVAPTHLVTELECGFLQPSELVLKVYAENRSGLLVQKTVQSKRSSIRVDLSGRPSVASVALICAATGETLDQRTFRDGVPWREPNVEVELPPLKAAQPAEETLELAGGPYSYIPRNKKTNPRKIRRSKVLKLPKEFETAFNNYKIVRQVGSGGSGTVFEVKASDGQTLALKLLDRSKTPRQKLKRFQNEIQFCLRPGSEHIVQVLDYGQAPDGSVFYIMPYYSSTLRGLIKKRLPKEELLPLYGQILDAVEAAHLLGVCHRDIKPENLLYDSGAKRVVLADFGIARFQEEQLLTTVNTGPHERLANFAYAAPEQRVPGQTVDQRADIYAIGLILNEMFTGQIPQGTMFRQIKEVAPEFAYLDGLVEMMLRQQPEQRFQSVTRVKEELIGRGNQFIRLQRLEVAKKQIVPDSEVSDPIISDPIRVVEKEDYRNGTLTLRLNRSVNRKWEECFRFRATAFSANVSAAMMTFQGDRLLIRVTDHFVPSAVEYFKQYCVSANEEYAARIRREHREEIERRRAELKRQVAEEETRSKILEKIHL